MVGPVPFGPLVAALDRLHFMDRPLWIVRLAVGHRHRCHPVVFSFLVEEISDQMTDLALGRRLHGSLFGDHGLAAKLANCLRDQALAA